MFSFNHFIAFQGEVESYFRVGIATNELIHNSDNFSEVIMKQFLV